MSDSWAHFSADRTYRYLLGRRICDSKRRLLFIMLNPGTADEKYDDPTIRRCIGFAERWNFGVLDVANLFAFRTSYVKELRSADDPVGPENDDWISRALNSADRVVLAWGNHGAYKDRSRQVRQLAFSRTKPFHLGFNKTGEPKHPLYLRASTSLVPMRADILTNRQTNEIDTR